MPHKRDAHLAEIDRIIDQTALAVGQLRQATLVAEALGQPPPDAQERLREAEAILEEMRLRRRQIIARRRPLEHL